MAYFNRQVQDIPDSDPVPGAAMQVSRSTDGVSMGIATTDADGFAALTCNGACGPVDTLFLKGTTTWTDTSRSMMAVGSTALAELQTLIGSLHSDGVLPWGYQFFQMSPRLGFFTVNTGAVVLAGVLGVWWSATSVAVADGDRAIVAEQMHADGQIALSDIAYADIGSTTCVPLWRCTVASGSISNATWIGTPTLRGITSAHPCQFDNVRAASGSTTSAVGEVSAITTTLTLDTGIHYQVTADASFIARARDGAIAISIDGNLSSYRTNSGDVTAQLRNSHVRDVTGAGSCAVTLYHRSDTALTDWVLQATYGPAFNAINLSAPSQVAVDTSGNVYIADFANNRLVKIDSSGTYLTSVAVIGIVGVCVDTSGNVYVNRLATSEYAVRKYTSAFVQQWDTLTNLSTTYPSSTFLTTDGTHLYSTLYGSAQVIKLLCSTGTFVSVWGSTGSGDGQFSGPIGIAYSSTSSELYVVDANNSRVQVSNTSGTYQRQWAIPATSRGCAVDASGDLWVASLGSNALKQYASTGALLTTINQTGARGIGIASGDVLWVSNYTEGTIAKWDETAAAFNYDAALLTAIAIPRS